MGSVSGVAVIGEKPALVCPVLPGGIRVRNLSTGTGASTVWLGGPDVTAGDGYPLYPGGPAEDFTGEKKRSAPVVPSPPGDTDPEVLYGVTGKGESRVAWISAGGGG